MKSKLTWVGSGILFLGLLALPTGCQTPGKVVSKEISTACPTCTMETKTTAIKGVTYTKCVCPSCRTVSTVDPRLADSVRAYVGTEIGDTIHVCDHCKAIVESCPVCRQQAAK